MSEAKLDGTNAADQASARPRGSQPASRANEGETVLSSHLAACSQPQGSLESEPDDFSDDSESAPWVCDCCGKVEYDDRDGCPLCCNNGGAYAPGSEECDFCEYADECATR